MVLRELIYRPKIGGPAHGLPMLHVALGEGDDLSPGDVLKKISEAGKFVHQSCRVAVFEVSSGVVELDVSLLFRLLRDHGVVVALRCPGDSMPMYKDDAAYTIALVEEPDWLQFRAQEIHVVYRKGLVEPPIMQNNATADRNLIVRDSVKMTDVYQWMMGAQLGWKVVSVPKWSFDIDLM